MNLPRARTQERRFSRPLNFSLDSRNENLPEKRIHRNYALTTVPMSPRLRIGTKSPFMPAVVTGSPRRCDLRMNGSRAELQRRIGDQTTAVAPNGVAHVRH